MQIPPLSQVFSKFSVSVIACIILSTIAGCARVLTQPIVRRVPTARAMRRKRENDSSVTAQPIRVAVVTQHFPTSRVGWAGHTAYQTLRMLSQHCDVQVFYPEAVYPRFLPQPRVRKLSIDRNWAPSDVKTTYIPYLAIPVLSRSLNGFTIASRLLPQIRRYDPDIILSYTVYPDGYAAVSIGRSLGVPTVVKAIGSDLNSIPNRFCRMLTQSDIASRRTSSVRSVTISATQRANLAPIQTGRSPISTAVIRTSSIRETANRFERNWRSRQRVKSSSSLAGWMSAKVSLNSSTPAVNFSLLIPLFAAISWAMVLTGLLSSQLLHATMPPGRLFSFLPAPPSR